MNDKISILNKHNQIKKKYILGNILNEQIIFEITKEERKEATDAIIDSLKTTFQNNKFVPELEKWGWPFSLNLEQEKNLPKLFEDLVLSFIPLRYHFKYDSLKLNPTIEKILKKQQINTFYSKKLVDNKEKRLLFTLFMTDVLNKLDNIINTKSKSINIYSGHDTNLVNILTNILDVNKVKKSIKNCIEKEENIDIENCFNFYIPPFASSIFFELNEFSIKGSTEKELFINVNYNNNTITENWVEGIDFVEGKGIKLDNFIKVFKERVVKLDENGVWKCNFN